MKYEEVIITCKDVYEINVDGGCLSATSNYFFVESENYYDKWVNVSDCKNVETL